MFPWAAVEADLNASLLAEFGEPAVYQPMVNGGAVGSPVTLTVIRNDRVKEESGPGANWEGIDIDPTQLPNPPIAGDQVSVWGLQFTVKRTPQPQPYGFVTLILTQQAGPAI